jgi:hypothetical protein
VGCGQRGVLGARGGGNICGESKVVGGPPVVCLASGAAVGVSVFQILPVVVMHRIEAYELECVLSLILPGPCPCGYDVVEEGVEVNLIEVIVGEEEVPSFVTEFS